MISMAVVPILTVLCLLLLVVFVSNRRGTAVAALRQEVDHEIQTIRKKDRALRVATIESLIEGKPFGDCLKQLLTQRATLVGGNPRWSEEDLLVYRKKRLADASERNSRKLLLPAIAASVMLVAGCIVLLAVLYHFAPGLDPNGTRNIGNYSNPQVDVFDEFQHVPTPTDLGSENLPEIEGGTK